MKRAAMLLAWWFFISAEASTVGPFKDEATCKEILANVPWGHGFVSTCWEGDACQIFQVGPQTGVLTETEKR